MQPPHGFASDPAAAESGCGRLLIDPALNQQQQQQQQFFQQQQLQQQIDFNALQQLLVASQLRNQMFMQPSAAAVQQQLLAAARFTAPPPVSVMPYSYLLSPFYLSSLNNLLAANLMYQPPQQPQLILPPASVDDQIAPQAPATPNSSTMDSASTLASPNNNGTSGAGVLSPEEVEQRIASIISRNEALLEEASPMLQRRRSSIRHQQHVSFDLPRTSASTSNGRGIRSQSLVETIESSVESPLAAAAAPLNAANFHLQVENDTAAAKQLFNCKFCALGVRHFDELTRHEEKCAKRGDTTAAAAKMADCKLPLKKRVLPSDGAAATRHIFTSITNSILEEVQPATAKSAPQEIQLPLVKVQSAAIGVQSGAVQVHPVSLQVQPVSVHVQPPLQPYCVTIKIPAAVGGGERRETTQVTDCLLRRPAPCPTTEEGQRSEYAHWSQLPVSPSESKLNVMMMNGCVMRRPRSAALKYTTARKDSNLMCVTHSSYWAYAKKLLGFASPPVPADQPEHQPEHQVLESPSEVDVTEEEEAPVSGKETLKNILMAAAAKKVSVCNGGYKTNETYTYVRGRGRGRYVCARCGIRCKKPSMLKKHIRTHLNVRPYSCSLCMFSFKTKGNLTKHLKSKAHSKKVQSEKSTSNENEQTYTMDTGNEDSDETLSDDELETMSDDEMDAMAQQVWQHGTDSTGDLRRRSFSYRNVWNRVRTGMYKDRQVRTPPANFACSSSMVDDNFDRCDTAPPSLAVESRLVDFCASADHVESFPSAAEAKMVEEKPSASSAAVFHLQPHKSTFSVDNYINSMHEGKIRCDICGKEFVKAGLLKLHMAAHQFEQSSRRYDYKCQFCNSCFRSKNLLSKHLLHAHPQHHNAVPAGAAVATQTPLPSNIVPSAATATATTAGGSKPRPFECVDCAVAFRIHGHLAKHLRSKSHIMKLECLEKIPIGTFAKLEESNSDYLADIDTSDSSNSLKSLLKLAQRLSSEEEPKKPSPHLQEPRKLVLPQSQEQRKALPQEVDGHLPQPQELLELKCNEELPPSPPLPPAAKTVVADVWVPPRAKEAANGCAKEEVKVAEAPAAKLRCRFCAAEFCTQMDLELHWHADHVFMRDGNNFKCPRANCDTVYPSRRDLRTHLSGHYYGTFEAAAAPPAADVSKSTVAALSKKLEVAAADKRQMYKAAAAKDNSPLSDSDSRSSRSCMSPLSTGKRAAGGNEEPPLVAKRVASEESGSPVRPSPSPATDWAALFNYGLTPQAFLMAAAANGFNTSKGVNGGRTFNTGVVSQEMGTAALASTSVFTSEHFRCILCRKQCSSPVSLQQHLMSHAVVDDQPPRNYVCRFCDAAFTTSNALAAHTPCKLQNIS